MQPEAPQELLARAAEWEDLTRWERAELGRALRRLGWSYREIRELIPVPKGTLAGWCRDIRLSDDQVSAIHRRTGSAKGVPRDTQWRRREEIERIRAEARAEVPELIAEPLWLAGTVMYWAEGNKTGSVLGLSNSDADVCRLFIQWTRRYHGPAPQFVLKLNLHAANDEPAARAYWARATGLHDSAEFYRTYIKPDGTGHRKNHLAHGVVQVRVRRSADAFHRTLAWIEALPAHLTVLSAEPGC